MLGFIAGLTVLIIKLALNVSLLSKFLSPSKTNPYKSSAIVTNRVVTVNALEPLAFESYSACNW